jgi:hypothetical protein
VYFVDGEGLLLAGQAGDGDGDRVAQEEDLLHEEGQAEAHRAQDDPERDLPVRAQLVRKRLLRLPQQMHCPKKIKIIQNMKRELLIKLKLI